MKTNRRLLNGETLTLDVPDASALAGSTAISVLSFDGLEVEVTSGTRDDLDYYLSLSGTELGSRIQLRSGHPLHYGRYAGDPAEGLGFAVPVGSWWVYGFSASGTDAEGLAAQLAEVGLQDHPDGPALTPSGSASWSPYRTHTVAQMVTTAQDAGPGSGYLLDVRRTRSGSETSGRGAGDGIAVRGGRLSRSSVQERHAYAVLEAADFIVYGVPGGAEDLDRVATSMSQVTAELG